MIKISIEKIKMDIMDIFIRWFLNIFQYIRVKGMNKTFQIYFSNQFDRPSCIEMSVIPRNPLSRYYLNRASYLVERTPINAPHRKEEVHPSIIDLTIQGYRMKSGSKARRCLFEREGGTPPTSARGHFLIAPVLTTG